MWTTLAQIWPHQGVPESLTMELQGVGEDVLGELAVDHGFDREEVVKFRDMSEAFEDEMLR